MTADDVAGLRAHLAAAEAHNRGVGMRLVTRLSHQVIHPGDTHEVVSSASVVKSWLGPNGSIHVLLVIQSQEK